MHIRTIGAAVIAYTGQLAIRPRPPRSRAARQRPSDRYKRSLKPTYRLALAADAVAGCSSSNAASTTTTASVAPPTPPPTTTTTVAATQPSPSTTAPPTTAPPTTIDRQEAAEAEIIARYHAFSAEADACFASPSTCDLPTNLAAYANPDTDPLQTYTRAWAGLVERGEKVTGSDRIERHVSNVTFDGVDSAASTACVKDASIVVDSDGAPTDDRVGYWREDFVWTRVDGIWRIETGMATAVDPNGDSECTF